MAFTPYFKFRFSRIWRKVRRRWQYIRKYSRSYMRTHIFKRWERLSGARGFVFSWWGVMILIAFGLFIQTKNLDKAYLYDGPAPGGTFIEGVVGQATLINPIFANDNASSTAAALVFDSLYQYDEDGKLEPELATSYEIKNDNKSYVVKLREDVTWHDGQGFTADDVVFTFDAIKHPDSRSPLNISWRDIKVSKVDDYTVRFDLPNAFTPFIHSLTTGIIPEHILAGVDPSAFRAAEFNQDPIGTGPFKFVSIDSEDEEQRIRFEANREYFKDEVQLDRFVLRTFVNHESMIGAYKNAELTSMAGIRTFENDSLEKDETAMIKDLPLASQVFVFFNTKDDVLKNKKIRRGLAQATSNGEISRTLDFRYPRSDSPLLKGQLGYNGKITQPGFNLEKADKTLDSTGYKLASDGVRRNKAGEALEFELFTQNSDEYPSVADSLQAQWQRVGVKVNVRLLDSDELQQSHIRPHNYQMLLYGINIGSDPDVYPFWHSSQTGLGGFNLSLYENDTVDNSLEAGRTRTSQALRTAKYEAFLKQWTADVPAVALYRPAYTYVHHPRFRGDLPKRVAEPSSRFYAVEGWTINLQPTLLIEKED